MGPLSYGEALLVVVRAGLGWTASNPLKSLQLLSEWMPSTHLWTVRCRSLLTHHRAPSEGSVPCSRVPDWHQHTFQFLFNKQGLNWEPSASQLSPLQMETWSMERKVKYKLTVRAFGKTRVQIFNAQCAHLHSSSWLSCSVDLIFPSKRSSAETRWEAAR